MNYVVVPENEVEPLHFGLSLDFSRNTAEALAKQLNKTILIYSVMEKVEPNDTIMVTTQQDGISQLEV